MSAKVRTSWPPCARCKDPDGDIVGTNKTPNRYGAAQFGLGGQVCRSCYDSLKDNPNAVMLPNRRLAAYKRLAAAVLAFRDALNGNDTQQQADTLATMLAMAEQVAGRVLPPSAPGQP